MEFKNVPRNWFLPTINRGRAWRPWYSRRRRMESDVEEGEIRESECLSPLSDDTEQEFNRHRGDSEPSRKRQRFDKHKSRTTRRLNSTELPNSTPRRDSRDWNSRQSTSYTSREDKNRRTSGDSRRSHKSGSGDNRSRSRTPSGQSSRKRHFSSENRQNGRLSNDRVINLTTSTTSKTHTRTQKSTTSRDVKEDDNSHKTIALPFPVSSCITCESSNNDERAKQKSPASPVVFEYEPPHSPDNLEDTGRVRNITESIELKNEENEVEVLSIIDKSNRVCELIVIDSTSSSESEADEDLTDFEDPDKEKTNFPSELIPPPSNEINDSTVLPDPLTKKAPRRRFTQTLTPVTLSSTTLETVTDIASVQPSTSSPKRNEIGNLDSEDEDVYLLELRIKALEGLMNKIPSGDSQSEKTMRNDSKLSDPLSVATSTDVGETVQDDSEKENELELQLLRSKLLSDLEKKKKKKDELSESAKRKTDSAKKVAALQVSRRHSPKQRNHHRQSNPSQRGGESRRRSSDIRHYNSRPTRSRHYSSVDTRKSSHSKSQNKSKTTNKHSLPTVSRSNISTLSVCVSKDGKERTVVSHKPTATTTTTTTPLTNAPSPITIEKTDNLQRIVRIVPSSPTKVRKTKATTGSKLVNTSRTSGPQKVLVTSSALMKKTIAIKPTLPVLPPPTTNNFNITRTIINTNAHKSKYQTKKNYHTLKRTSSGKKIQHIVIPLRDNDKSTEEEESDEEEEEESKSPKPPEDIQLPKSFHSSLDLFLKSVRLKASLNGIQQDTVLQKIVTPTDSPSKTSEQSIDQGESTPEPAMHSSVNPSNSNPNLLDILPAKSPSNISLKAIDSGDDAIIVISSEAIEPAIDSLVNLPKSNLVEILHVKAPLKSPVKAINPGEAVSFTTVVVKPAATNVLLVEPAKSIPKEILPVKSPKKYPVKTTNLVSKSAINSKSATITESIPASAAAAGDVSPAKSNPGEILADQMTRTREELQLREKLLRATFKNREIKLNLTKTEQEFLTKRQEATSMLVSAIDQINQHSEKRDQCTRLERQVEKLKKQLEIAEKSLFVRKKEAVRLHKNAITAITNAFDVRSKSINCGTQCKKLGQELSGEQYKIPSAGAGEMLTKFKEIYKLTTHEELKKGPINFKKLENEIITSFVEIKVSEPEPSTSMPRSGSLLENSKEKDESSLKIYDGLIPLPNVTDKMNHIRSAFMITLPKDITPSYFRPYKSPLVFLHQPSNLLSLNSYDTVICKYDVLGSCNTRDCKFQHFTD